MRVGDADVMATWFRGADSYLDVEKALADLDPDRSAVMACGYNGSMDASEGVSAAIITMRCIAKQAIALGYVSEHIDAVALFPGPGTAEDNESGFAEAVRKGYPVLYDACFGFDDKAIVKDEWFTRTFDSNGRTALTAGPITNGIKDLVARRMVLDACRKFGEAIGGKKAGYVHESAVTLHAADIVEIATLGRRSWSDDVLRWKTREFEITAGDWNFLQRAVAATIEDGRAVAAQDVDALSDIWQEILRTRHVFFDFDDNIAQYKNLIIETARDLGIDSPVAAYYADVPVEDIIA